MNRFALSVGAIVFFLCLNQASDGTAEPHAIYDPATGNIQFCSLNGENGLSIWSTSGALIGANGINFGQLYDPSLSPFNLAWADFGGGLHGNPVAGNVVQPFTLHEDLRFEYVSIGVPIQLGQIVVQNLGGTHECPVPEPSGAVLALAAAAMAGLVRCERRELLHTP